MHYIIIIMRHYYIIMRYLIIMRYYIMIRYCSLLCIISLLCVITLLFIIMRCYYALFYQDGLGTKHIRRGKALKKRGVFSYIYMQPGHGVHPAVPGPGGGAR